MVKPTSRKAIGALAILGGLALLAWVAAQVLERRAVQSAGRALLTETLPPMEGQVELGPAPRPEPGSVVGRIVIEEAGVDAVALEGVDLETLRLAAGHFPGTALPGEVGNSSFAAHRDSFFHGLRNVDIGQEVRVETPRAVHTYAIERTRIVEPTRVDAIDPRGGRHLTLITCYPFDYVGAAPQRFVVHARWVGAQLREPT